MALHDWIQICQAAGLETHTMTSMDMYLKAGRIIHDKVVLERKKSGSHTIPHGATLKVLQAMTPAERIELRKRISA